MSDLTTGVGAELKNRIPELRSRKRLDAVVEASRAAVLVAVPRLRGEHDNVVRRADATPARPSRPTWGIRDTVTVVALLLGLLAAGLVLPSPRNGRPALGVDTAALWVGLCAVAAFAIFVALERGRRDTLLLGAHTRGAWRLYIVLAVVWAAVFVYMSLNWDDVDRFEPQLPIAGLVLLGLSVVGMAGLAVVARRRDRIALLDPAVAAKDEWGVSVGDGDPVDEWWASLPTKLAAAERSVADRSYGTTIDVLEREGIIRAGDARRLRRKNPSVVWRGDAG
ncbi:hypothetical protein DEU34_0446 [Microbacterium sp. AG1240]|uniref:hypothetical protein n=1 Tax=Microbacterium sp. AG1240 TaxID=2183992 RepID=UPI000EB29221|nr:hypothetical protein [Microbacterium sp. AG1240]RKT35940.1 hypothetical protein DEU34_0446 [Microbacterium sp. AG1240]